MASIAALSKVLLSEKLLTIAACFAQSLQTWVQRNSTPGSESVKLC